MNTLDRRRLLATAAGAGAAAALGRWAEPSVGAAGLPGRRITIGQIGTGHEHASGKMANLRKLTDHYEAVSIAEPGRELRRKYENHSAYRGLTWMAEEQLLELARIIHGEIENPYPLRHELIVQQCLLEARGHPLS